MGFGHIYVDAPQEAILAALDRHLTSKGFGRTDMRPEIHPSKTKEIEETALRLFWISPRLGRWTGVFEYRYYNNSARQRWGYTDEDLAIALSRDLKAEAYRLEVVDQAGFWLYAHYLAGEEKDGLAYHDTPADRTTDPSHKRYALNRIIEREGFKNLGVGYENIPGPMVRPVEAIPQRPEGIEGLEGFVHRAYAVTSGGESRISNFESRVP